MAKKKSPSSDTPSDRPASPRRRAAKKADTAPAAAPIDVSTIAGTEPIETAADRGTPERPDETRTAAEPTHSEIAEAAYKRYLGRGGQGGRDFDDWIEAERELRAGNSR